MKQNNQTRCGDCPLFEYEDTEGTGVCAFHQTVITCDTEACGDLPVKSPQESLTDMHRIERILNRKKMNTETLLKAIEDETGITLTQIQSKCRKEQFVYARRIITHHMANMEGYPDRYIAAFINRNRSTVNLMRRGHRAEYDNNPGFRKMFDAIIEKYNINIKNLKTWKI